MKKIILLSWFAAMGLVLKAQEIPKVSNCYFIANAEVVVQPGQSLSKASIIVRDGLIEAVGKNLKKPVDAIEIKADSMFVYAGFIDALSNTVLEEEDKDAKKKEDKPKSPGVATFEQAGITPQLKAETVSSPKSKAISAMRKEGFGISHCVPKGYMMSGTGALFSLKEAESLDDILLRKDIGLMASLRTKRGVFPSTLIGAMSRWREIHRNTDIYNRNKKLQARPGYNKEYEAYTPVYSGAMPVFFQAEQPKDIHRALTLQKELGFSMILSEVKLISPILDMVSNKQVVLLSLDLPKEQDDEKKEKSGKDKKGKKEDKEDEEKAGEKKEEKKKEEKKDPEALAFDARKKESYDTYMTQAKIISESGRPFAFSYLSVKTTDIHKNIKRLVKAGMAEEKALAALTTNPASVLNIAQMAGTIEKGKLANLVITDKALFDEKSNIQYVMVEGNLDDYKKEEKKKSGDNAGELGDIAGTWRYTADVPDQTQAGNLYLEKDGDSYKISLEADDTPGEVDDAYNVSVDGTSITFNLDITTDQGTMKLDFSINFQNNDRFEGTVTVAQFGSFPFTGDKRYKPDHH